MTKRRNLLIVLWLSIGITGIHAQGFLHRDGKKIVDGNGQEVILKGLNFGNSMVQEGYMMGTEGFAGTQHTIKAKLKDLMGDSLVNVFYKAWLNNHVSRADIDLIKSQGMNSVRIPIHYEYFTKLDEDIWYEWGFTFLDSIVSWCSASQIYAIIDLHAAPGGQGENADISDYDNTKPSLWESAANKSKTIALWKKLAERYKDEGWVGGYDLINETNWYKRESMGPKNDSLASLLKKITAGIRTIDTNHIIFIEGNGFANDFNGLTPVWDDNMVYSFHKYWSTNQQSTIQWVLDLRNNHNVPLWCGETGENSNYHFTREMELFDKHGIGVAWWPMKKFESINSFVVCKWPPGYEKIRSYLKSPTYPLDKDEAFSILMQLAENLKLSHASLNTGMFYAIMQQPGNTATMPFADHRIPGTIACSAYDIGMLHYAYNDQVYENNGSGSAYTPWNNGYTFRNDGVDLEACSDLPYTNGFSVGWTETGEWLNYTVNVDSSGFYDVVFRVASGSSGGIFHLENSRGEYLTGTLVVPSTGAWDKWTSITAENVRLSKGTEVISLIVDKEGFNANAMVWSGPRDIEIVPLQLLVAETNFSGDTIMITFNNELKQELTLNPGDFTLTGGTALTVESIVQDKKSPKKLALVISGEIMFDNVLRLSFSGNSIMDTSNTLLASFSNKPVLNRMQTRIYLPGKIEAEEYSENKGMAEETTTDSGGGINLGYIDAGDYTEYLVYVKTDTDYVASVRGAGNGGKARLLLMEGNVGKALCNITLKSTGGWQNWSTFQGTDTFRLGKGAHTIRFSSLSGGYNVNYFTLSIAKPLTNNMAVTDYLPLTVYPNPSDGFFSLKASLPVSSVEVLDITGKSVYSKEIYQPDNEIINFNLSHLARGLYLLKVISHNHSSVLRISIN